MNQTCELLNKIQQLEHDLLAVEHDEDRQLLYFEINRLKRNLEEVKVS